ncbi:MAG: C39 family peptidase [Anaerolineales bacterium]|nr:C39 family peptidase [Anaerolineales bacterium]
MRNKKRLGFLGGIVALNIAALLLYRIPSVNRRISWQLDIASTYLRGIIQPASGVPTPVATISIPRLMITPTVTPTPTQSIANLSLNQTKTLTFTATPSVTPTAIPGQVSLPRPAWIKQDWNNCGPATLAMYLRFYGWQGDQFDISDVLKPQRNDRNVNVEELVYYARNYAGWLNTIYRVGEKPETLKYLIAAGFPVMIESSFYFEAPYWRNDDLWAAHYLLVTGYDDTRGAFTAQDSYHGADRTIPYATFDEYWRVFNRVIILSYLPDDEKDIRAILGDDWDERANRQHALETAQEETVTNPEDAFAWFNLGTNLVYFEQYDDAADAYDTARNIGLPQRMLRYQFGPFFAYFQSGRNDDLLTLTKYALQRTPNSEEALLWHGWALYREGDVTGAIADFNQALKVRPGYLDAQYALNFVLGE